MMSQNVEGEVDAHTGNSNTKQITEIEEPNMMGERKGNVAGGIRKDCSEEAEAV